VRECRIRGIVSLIRLFFQPALELFSVHVSVSDRVPAHVTAFPSKWFQTLVFQPDLDSISASSLRARCK
jgi:hypothetical protein